jgi:pimeloyl-ACP methyl ester carboxylesterase
VPTRLPTPTWRCVEVDGAKVELMEVGAGDPLVFLHGWGLSPRSYAGGLARLTSAGLRVIAPSLPGFGGSDPLPLLHGGMAEQAARVAAALEAAGLEQPAFVVGHSYGGGVALQLATDRPDLVRSLTLVNSVGGAPGPGDRLSDRSYLRWALGAVSELHPLEMARLAPRALRDFVPSALRHPLAFGSTALLALRASLADEASRLVADGMPLLLIWSDRDRLVAPGRLSEVTAQLPPEVVRGRHGWLLSSPSHFAELLRNALVVHAMLERRDRGDVIRLPRGTELRQLIPHERRRRRRPGGAADRRDPGTGA